MKTQSQNILLMTAIVLCSCAILPARAQFSLGVRAGANFATEPVTGLYHEELARPYVGLFAGYKTSCPIAFQLGLNYSGEGANYRDLSTDDTYKVRHSFLTIPVMVQYRFGFGGYIEAGPQFGLLLSAKAKTDDEPYTDTKSYYKGTDVSAGIGLGYDIKKGSLKGFGISVRYMRGLTNINKEAVGDNTDIKSRTLAVGLSYTLGK